MCVAFTGRTEELAAVLAVACAVVFATSTAGVLWCRAGLGLVFPASALEALQGLQLRFLRPSSDSTDIDSVSDDLVGRVSCGER